MCCGIYIYKGRTEYFLLKETGVIFWHYKIPIHHSKPYHVSWRVVTLLTSVQLSPTAAAGNTRKTDRWVYTHGLQARPQNYVELNSNFLKALPAIFSWTQALLLFLFLSWRSIHWYLSQFPGSDPNWLPLGGSVLPLHYLSCHHLLSCPLTMWAIKSWKQKHLHGCKQVTKQTEKSARSSQPHLSFSWMYKFRFLCGSTSLETYINQLFCL